MRGKQMIRETLEQAGATALDSDGNVFQFDGMNSYYGAKEFTKNGKNDELNFLTWCGVKFLPYATYLVLAQERFTGPLLLQSISST